MKAKIILIMLCLFVGMNLQAGTGGPQAKRPNIIFLLTDDQRNDTLGCAGHPIVKTPVIDDLAANGVRFENAFVTTSICAASRASIFTGLYERTHGYTFGKSPISQKHMEQSYPTLLRNNGYHTGFVGKYGVRVNELKTQDIFDAFKGIGRGPYFKEQEDGTLRHETELCGDWAVDFLNNRPKEKPFCLSISFNASHAEDGDKRPGIGHFPWPKAVDGMYEDIDVPAPRLSDPKIFEAHPEFMKQSMNRARYGWRWDTPEKYQTNIRAYFRMISGIDRVIGRVRSELDKLGLADNTVIFYMGDNGYYMGDRGFAGKWSHYDQSLRVPLIIYDPRLPKERRGVVSDKMALNLDTPATMLDLAGVEIPKHYQGKSLLPLIYGEVVKDWRKDFFCEHLMDNAQIPKYRGIRDERYVYANYFEKDYEYLHDLKTDPDQLVNLASDPEHKEVLESMHKRCEEIKAACPEKIHPPREKKVRPRKKSGVSAPAVKKSKARAKKLKSPPVVSVSKPNVVFLLSDDQGWGDYGFMGHPHIQTPRLDKLATEGLIYERGYVTAPLCGPSLASLATGLYPHQTGVRGNDPVGFGQLKKSKKLVEAAALRNRMIAPMLKHPSFIKELQAHGYSTLQTGKWWEGNPLDHGFDEAMTHGNFLKGGRHGDEGLAIGRKTMQPIYDHVDKALANNKPFFIWYGVFLPHSPHNAPPRIFNKYKDIAPNEPTAWYWANCEWLDETCGQIVDYLKKKGVYENTLFVYTCDNGWRQDPNRRHKYDIKSKREPHEMGIRTPIFITYQAGISPMRDKTTLASNIDIAPTILKACGIKVPKGMSGLDLRDPEALKKRDQVFVDIYDHDSDLDKLDDIESCILSRVVIDGWDKIIWRPEGVELYDLKKDLDDENDLAEKNPGKASELEKIMKAWLEETK